jgi:hypothetical protein
VVIWSEEQSDENKPVGHAQGRGKLPPVVDLAFASRVSHYGNGSKRVAAGEGKRRGAGGFREA